MLRRMTCMGGEAWGLQAFKGMHGHIGCAWCTSSDRLGSKKPPGPYAIMNLVTLLLNNVEDCVGRRDGRSVYPMHVTPVWDIQRKAPRTC